MSLRNFKNTLKVFAVLSSFALLTGCGEPTIDPSSEADLQSSVEAIKESLPTNAARASLDRDLESIGQYTAMMLRSEGHSRPGLDMMLGKMEDTIAGMDAQELAEYAELSRYKMKELANGR